MCSACKQLPVPTNGSQTGTCDQGHTCIQAPMVMIHIMGTGTNNVNYRLCIIFLVSSEIPYFCLKWRSTQKLGIQEAEYGIFMVGNLKSAFFGNNVFPKSGSFPVVSKCLGVCLALFNMTSCFLFIYFTTPFYHMAANIPGTPRFINN